MTPILADVVLPPRPMDPDLALAAVITVVLCGTVAWGFAVLWRAFRPSTEPALAWRPAPIRVEVVQLPFLAPTALPQSPVDQAVAELDRNMAAWRAGKITPEEFASVQKAAWQRVREAGLERQVWLALQAWSEP